MKAKAKPAARVKRKPKNKDYFAEILKRIDELPPLLVLKEHLGGSLAQVRRLLIEKDELGRDRDRLHGELRTAKAYIRELERQADEHARGVAR